MEVGYDWSLLSVDGVGEVIEQAATKVANHYEVDFDDLHQEARLLVVDLSTNLPECIHQDDLGLLQYRLEQDLVDLFKREVRNRGRHESYEERYDALYEDEQGESLSRPEVVHHQRSSEPDLYTRELVELLLPAVWDEDYCYGVRVENAADADMPRGSTNKATGNTLAAHLADIKWGWRTAPLTDNERRALFLCIGMDWEQKDAARSIGCSQQSVSNWFISGVGKIVGTLNGNAALLDEYLSEAA